jgi:hypothetical protein
MIVSFSIKACQLSIMLMRRVINEKRDENPRNGFLVKKVGLLFT